MTSSPNMDHFAAIIDFSTPSNERNLSLEIEEEILYVSRETLALYSPVFYTMFYGRDFRESAQTTPIKLPGKRLVDFRELLYVLTPPIFKSVDEDNVDLMLDYSREYSIDKLKGWCNEYLQRCLLRSSADGNVQGGGDGNNGQSSERHLDILILACKYEMYDLMEMCIPKVAQLASNVIDGRQADLPPGVLAALYQAKLSKWKRHIHHNLTGSLAQASARSHYNTGGGGNGGGGLGQAGGGGQMAGNPMAQMNLFGQPNQPTPGMLSYFCSACNSTFSSNHQRYACKFCKATICDDCARSKPCPKLLDHDDTCDCDCEYNRDLLRRTNNV